MPKTVLIVDDHPSFRASARLLLEAGGYEVLGEADDGRSALDATDRLGPDIVLLDVRLPDMDGFEVARQMLEENGQALQVVLTSSHDLSDLGGDAGGNGVRGFIPKAELTGDRIRDLLR